MSGFKNFTDFYGSSTNVFEIDKRFDIDLLPDTCFCFNRLYLPEYTSYEMLKNKLLFKKHVVLFSSKLVKLF